MAIFSIRSSHSLVHGHSSSCPLARHYAFSPPYLLVFLLVARCEINATLRSPAAPPWIIITAHRCLGIPTPWLSFITTATCACSFVNVLSRIMSGIISRCRNDCNNKRKLSTGFENRLRPAIFSVLRIVRGKNLSRLLLERSVKVHQRIMWSRKELER